MTSIKSRTRDAVRLFAVLGLLAMVANPASAPAKKGGRGAHPETTITGGPSGTTTSTSASFGFTSSLSGSSFRCKLDADTYIACASPTSYSNLAGGSHSFAVYAISPEGWTEKTPAVRSFTVSAPDTTAPETTIVSGPAGDTGSTSASFGLLASESGSTFRCTLDGQPYVGCSSPKAYSGVAEGSHRFAAYAVDAAGNPDPSPATRTFNVVAMDGDCGWGALSSANRPSACWRPYSDSSPFNRALPEAPADVAGSSAIVSRTLGFGQAGSRGGTWFTGGVADTSSDYDHPIYFSQPSDPLYTVHCRKWVSSCEVNGLQVRIPAAARAAGGTDAHMAVIDQQSGWEYDFWETESLPAGGGDLYIGHGGMTAIGTPDADGLGSNATAAHFGLAAGVVRPEELAAGHIEHALFMIVKCTNGTYVWPAEGPGVGRTCSSMGLSNSDAPALGQHFYLDLSDAEIDALGVPAWKKTVLHAMADYGMFVGDTGSDYLGWSLVVESGSGYTSFGQPDPWVSLAKEYGIASSYRSDIGQGVYYFDLAKTVNWGSELQVASPCVSRGTC
jgi:hypothetical protein